MLERCATVVAGTCRHPERMVLRSGRLRPITMPSLVGLLVHPTEGVVLFDAGYAPRLHRETARLPGRLYELLVPFHAPEGAVDRLAELGIAADDVRHVVISHFHPDHIGGLADFPRATYHVSSDAWRAVQGLSGLRALLGGWFPALLPGDFLDRAHLVDHLPDPGYGPFERGADLFGDGSLRLISLPGHAAGQLGLVAETGARRVLFAADACWVSEGYRSLTPPSRLTRLITDDPDEAERTLRKLHDAWRADPDLCIVPAHCPEAPVGEIPCG